MNYGQNMQGSIGTLVENLLPTVSRRLLTYSAEGDMVLSNGYTSAAGNTYYCATCASGRLAIRLDIGEGYLHTFLNGITIYAWDGEKVSVIAKRKWGGCNYLFFNKNKARALSAKMLSQFLVDQLQIEGAEVSECQLLAYSQNLVNETFNGSSSRRLVG